MDDVSIVIGTFGDVSWAKLARERAVPSARALGVPVIHEHRESLHAARNAGLARVRTEWVVHLDADDELDVGYLEQLQPHTGVADVIVPSVTYVRGGRGRAAHIPRVAGHRHDCEPGCLEAGNWIVVGAAVRTELVRSLGGWRAFQVYEDWDLWLRCYRAGARVARAPAAVYVAHVRPDSRNRAPSMETKNLVHRQILEANGAPA